MENLQKIIYLLRPVYAQSKETRKKLLLKECAPGIIDAGAEKLVMYIDDEGSAVRSPAPKPLFEKLPVAAVEVWLKDLKEAPSIEKILKDKDFTLAGYRVDESVYREYGGNVHMRARDWPEGNRSPGVVSVNLLRRPKKLDHEEWMKNWFTIISPVSEAIQPRGRYVRNMVQESLTGGAPVYDGIVIEAWPSKRHVENPFLFYGASNPLELVKNVLRILKAVRSFLKVRQVRTVMMSEYFVKTGFKK